MKSEGSDMRIMPGSVERPPPPSLVDLCVNIVIANVRYLGDVGETDSHLLEQILPHCTSDQLMHVENSTIGRDLSPVTDELWMKFYKKDFGEKNFNLVIERMNNKKVSFRWKQLYEAKTKDVLEAETVAVSRIKHLYQKADAQKQSRRIRICEKVPPSSNKRSWRKFANLLWLVSCICDCAHYLLMDTKDLIGPCAGNGPGYGSSGGKSSLMKKAKLDLLNSQEFKNLAAIRKNAVQRTYSPAPAKRCSGFSSKASGSTSNPSKPLGRRF